MAETEKRTMVVEYVQPSPRSWQPKDGGAELFFVTANFAGQQEGSIAVTADKVEDAKASLQALVGQPTEFELQFNKDYNGTKQWKIKGYPGKPATGGGGGGRSGSGGGGMSHAQAGYLAAASALGPSFGELTALGTMPAVDEMVRQVAELGELLTQSLFDRKPPEPLAAAQAEAAATPTVTRPVAITLAQLKAIKDLIAEKGWTTEKACEMAEVAALTDLTEAQAAQALEAWA